MKRACFSCGGSASWCSYCNPSAEDADVNDKEGTWIQTWSGKQLWPLSPDPDTIDIMDIAVGLSREHRYKQAIRSYMVAEHSVIVSRLVERFARSQEWTHGRDLARHALLYRCPQGLLNGDEDGVIPAAVTRVRACVFTKFGLTLSPGHEVIDAIDKRLCLDEVRQVMRRPELYAERHAGLKPCGVTLECLGEEQALALFLDRFHELFPEHEIDLGDATFLP